MKYPPPNNDTEIIDENRILNIYDLEKATKPLLMAYVAIGKSWSREPTYWISIWGSVDNTPGADKYSIFNVVKDFTKPHAQQIKCLTSPYKYKVRSIFNSILFDKLDSDYIIYEVFNMFEKTLLNHIPNEKFATNIIDKKPEEKYYTIKVFDKLEW